MTKIFFHILILGLLLSITTTGSYAQVYDATTGISYPPSLDRYLEIRRSHLRRITLDYFQREANREGKGKVYLQSEVEFQAMLKGDTTRIIYAFDNSVIAHIEIEGVGATTPEDIQKGQFVVMVSPEQTTLYKTNIHVKSANDSIVVLKGVANRRVIVIEGDRKEYSRVMNNLWYAKGEKNRPAGEYRYLNSIAGGVPEGLWVYAPEKLNEYLGQISGKGAEMQLTSGDIPDTKTLLQRETERFDSVKLYPGKWLSTSLEHAVIARGDSTRIKFVFDNREVRGIQVVGYEKASRDDLKKGEYIVTVSPKKTKLIECWVFKRDWRRTPAHYRIIVVDPEKYNEVMRKYYTLRAQGRSNRQYLNELADGVPER